MENQKNMEGFEELKAQYDALCRRMDKQKIVTEKMMREVMRSRVGVARKKFKIEIMCYIYVLLVALPIFLMVGLSVPFVIVTGLIIIGHFAASIYTNKDILRGRMTDGSLLDISSRVARALRLESLALRWSIAVCAIWVPWILWEMYNNYDLPGFEHSGIVGLAIGVIGALIGGWIGFRLDLRVIRTYRQMLNEIKEFSEE